MSDTFENQACNQFAESFGRLLATSVSGASGSPWQIALADPQPEPMPSPASPVQFCLGFGGAMSGACYAVFDQADLLVFLGSEKVSAGATASATAAHFLVLLRGATALLQKEFPGEEFTNAHGAVTLQAEPADARDPSAVQALQLRATTVDGAVAQIVLYFEPRLLASFAAAGAGLSAGAASPQANLGLVMDVELTVTLRFGQRQLSLREILDLASGSVVELDRQVDEPVELMLDGKVIARGEAVIIDGNYGLRVTQVLQPVTY